MRFGKCFLLLFSTCAFGFDKSRLWSCVSAVGANFYSSDIKAFMLGKGTAYYVLLDKGTKWYGLLC